MNQENFFKTIVVVNWVLQFLLYALPMSLWNDNENIAKLISFDGYSAIVRWENPIVYLAPLLGFLLASVGMLFYKNWARYLYLALWLYGWIAALLFGYRVSAPIQGFIGILVGTIDGMVLYLVFLSTLRGNFTSGITSIRNSGIKGPG